MLECQSHIDEIFVKHAFIYIYTVDIELIEVDGILLHIHYIQGDSIIVDNKVKHNCVESI